MWRKKSVKKQLDKFITHNQLQKAYKSVCMGMYTYCIA